MYSLISFLTSIVYTASTLQSAPPQFLPCKIITEFIWQWGREAVGGVLIQIHPGYYSDNKMQTDYLLEKVKLVGWPQI